METKSSMSAMLQTANLVLTGMNAIEKIQNHQNAKKWRTKSHVYSSNVRAVRVSASRAVFHRFGEDL